ncbi:MAG: HAD family phosphatase [Asgard group archaeon]|nr:HAD family phosphatase [Asgard group archaeon]
MFENGNIPFIGLFGMPLIENLIEKWGVKCIIFDLDGTLVDTLDMHILAFVKLFQETNLSIAKERISENMGRTPKDTLLTLIPALKTNQQELLILANRKEEILTTLLEKVPLFNGAKEILEFLMKKKIPLALASSTPKFNVDKMLNSADIFDYFNVIITGEDITFGKPNPEVFLKAAEKGNFTNEECIVIGDSPHDVHAAKNAKMKIIAVNTGKHSFEEIQETKPDTIVKTLKELLF